MIKKTIIGLILISFIGLSFWELYNPPAITNMQVLPEIPAKWNVGICLKKFLPQMENPIFIKIKEVIPKENAYSVVIFTPQKGTGETAYQTTSSKLSFAEANELTTNPFCPKE